MNIKHNIILSFLGLGPFLLSCGGLIVDGTSLTPENMILAFNLSSCPDGWSEFSEGKGRLLLGTGSGGMDGNSNNLTSRSLGDTGGLEYKTAYAFNSNSGNSPIGTSSILAEGGTDTYWQGTRSLTDGLGGSPTDSNFPPFKVYLYCVKDSLASSNIPAAAISAQNSASCSGDWSADNDLAGRVTLGSGSGNLDSSSSALASRALGATGGRESVRGMPISSLASGSEQAAPGSGLYPSDSGTDVIYSSTLSANCLGADGCLNDPNLPPFIALNYCQLSTDSSTDFPSNTVAAFHSSSCPSGWSDYAAAAGRVILGVGSGNNDVDGNALTARNLGDTGGWEQTNSIPLGNVASLNTAANNYIGFLTGTDIIFNSSGVSGYSDPVADSNIAPYVAVKYCQKD